jgi:TatD DNase family protein
VTFKSSPENRAAAVLCPLDRLLVETDSPYLAPVPLRGRRNQPANVTVVGATVAEARATATENVAAATLSNARVAFRLPQP